MPGKGGADDRPGVEENQLPQFTVKYRCIGGMEAKYNLSIQFEATDKNTYVYLLLIIKYTVL